MKMLPRPAKIAVWAVLGCALAATAYLYFRDEGRGATQSTTDAYVRADSTFVAPRIAGQIAQVLVEDNQIVKQGQLLATIDDRDFVVAVASATADVNNARADLLRLKAAQQQQVSVIRQGDAAISADNASITFAEADARRYANLAVDGSGTVQERQQSQSQLQVAVARRTEHASARDAAQHQAGVLQAQQKQAEASLEKAMAALDAARLNLSYTRITAPIGGMVGHRTLRVGAYVNVGAPLLAVVPLKDAYIEANFRETQLRRVRAGQAVTIAVDMLPGIELRGHVESVAPASGIAFSPIAPDNATGNFTKVVQRVPVKIRIDSGQAAARDLRIGMSVVPTVHVRL
ncbi:HlyD family secretion protein [Cupriavidus pauculus]|uniref:HlyD family secretion protein n=1 Tax=Cupriavidus pauculus TaxID=82633 RepID=UPI001EE27A96|nr:HlyD family secretion protein [Cupriavidus pauculus]GJG95068.1 HlyD family secretion protein [Cupriavidus pauculus]